MAELDRWPPGTLEQLLFFRGYAEAKRAYDAACRRDPKTAQQEPAFARVIATEFALQRLALGMSTEAEEDDEDDDA